MPPKPKKRGFKSIIGGFSSLFSSSKERRRDDQPIAHDLPTVKGLPSQLDASPSLETPEGSTAGPAIPVITTEHPLPPHSDVGPSTGASAHQNPLPMEQTAYLSMFPNSQKFNVESINIDSSQHVHQVQNTQGSRIDGWKMLLKNIASNALHDSSARFDPPKCDEDTRVEVLNELMDWIQDRDAPQHLLCMTGAAGAGKSALQQTIAERCSGSNILGSAFFFSSGDPTRNNLSRIVPTIACQIGLHNLVLQDAIAKAVEKDPLIFSKKIKVQMDTLVVAPFKRVCASGKLDRNTFPHAILIDGLDECSGEENQAELLSTIKHCLLDDDLPFRIFIASRPEWAIRSALDSEPEGYLCRLAYHIKLSDKYDATGDTRRYLWRRLQDIGSRSRDRRGRSPLWPTKEDIEKLVAAASGQFVYAATVVKYLSEHRSSPVDRLRTIINWTPDGAQQARPFEALDILYTNILSAAKELYEAIDTHRGRDFLLLVRAHQINSDGRFDILSSTRDFDETIGLEEGGTEVLFSDLHSLIFFRQDSTITEVWQHMLFYHRSFSEFLDSSSRAEHLFVSETRACKYVVESCLQKVPQHEDYFWHAKSCYGMLDTLLYYSRSGAVHIDALQLISFTRNNGWGRLDAHLSSQQRADPSFLKWDKWARFTLAAIRRLKDELYEHELADIVKSYFDKWEETYKEYGSTIVEPLYVPSHVDGADEQDQDGDEGEPEASSISPYSS